MPAGSLFNDLDETNGFDENEYDAGSEENAQRALNQQPTQPQMVIRMEDDLPELSPEPEDDQLDEEMNEAERRINLAGYYKQLAKGGVFRDGSEEAAIVDQELREFARERMSVLLNLGTHKPKVELPFSEEQVQVLRFLADRYAQKKKTEPQGGAAPAVRPLAPPNAPAAPVAQRPTLPQVKPLAPPPTAREQSQAAPKPARAKKPAAAPKAKPKANRDYDDIPLGEVFEENGRQYKMVQREDGERLKVAVTKGQVRGHRGHRMPTQQEQQYISEQQAQRDLNANPAMKSDKMVLAAAISVANKGDQ